MAKRKTVQVEALKDHFNKLIEKSKTLEGRAALCYALSDILHETGNYKGFQYINGWKGVEDYRHRYL